MHIELFANETSAYADYVLPAATGIEKGELGRANDLPSDFSGPMAKQHRMAVITLAALLSVLEPLWNGRDQVLTLALWVVVFGAALTAFRRARNIVVLLREEGDEEEI